jgi:hypothetical protein
MTSHLLGPEHHTDLTILVHTDEQRAEYAHTYPHLEPYIRVTGVPVGMLGGQRNVMLDSVAEGEWFMVMDDDIQGLYTVPEFIWNQGRFEPEDLPNKDLHHRVPMSFGDLMARVEHDLLPEAARVGARLIGFAPTDNLLYNRSKYRYASFVVMNLCLVQKTRLRFIPGQISDFEYSAANLVTYGIDLLASWIYAKSRMYRPGGLGLKPERREARLEACRSIIAKYPGMVKMRWRDGYPDLHLITNTRSKVERWRSEWKAKYEAERQR